MLVNIGVCGKHATSNRNSYVPFRPQKNGRLGAEPDTAICLEPPGKIPGGSFLRCLLIPRTAGRDKDERPPRARFCLSLVVPANPGTHNHRPRTVRKNRETSTCCSCSHHGVWVPAFRRDHGGTLCYGIAPVAAASGDFIGGGFHRGRDRRIWLRGR